MDKGERRRPAQRGRGKPDLDGAVGQHDLAFPLRDTENLSKDLNRGVKRSDMFHKDQSAFHSEQ